MSSQTLFNVIFSFIGLLIAVVGFLLVWVLNNIHIFLKETRLKLDEHCENFELHHYARRSSDCHGSE